MINQDALSHAQRQMKRVQRQLLGEQQHLLQPGLEVRTRALTFPVTLDRIN